MRACCWLFLAVLLVVPGCAGQEPALEVETFPLALGADTVQVVVHRAARPGPTWLNLHDDEDTAVEAARAVVREKGGRVVELRHTGARNVRFRMPPDTFTVDPNRLFTDAGADTSLARLGRTSPAAHAAVRAFATRLFELLALPPDAPLLTLHNNTDERYSVRSYLPGAEYAQDALFVHVDEDQDPDDFFFVTDQTLYARLREGGFNVVMQNNALATDDGSLSVYAGQRGVPYVNVEAEHGHYAEQVRMIQFLYEVLGL